MDDLLQNLNEPQQEAVQHIDGPLLILAGAGSGKTRVITRRVAYLIRQGIDPYNVLAITFTNKAAEEMRTRIDALGTSRGATACTFHSLCARLLREFAQYSGLDPNYTIYDRNDQLKIAKQAIEELNLTGSYFTPAKAHSAISNAKNDMKTPAAYANQAGDFYTRNVAEIYTRYEKLLIANNAVDFDDLLLRMAFLLRDHREIREHLSQRYQYVLIDEYQDTNHAQYVIAHSIAAGHQNLCVTGDPDQSIYAWRGADISNILEFEKDYPGAKVIRLEENYRSVQPILTAASSLIAHNTQRKEKALFTRREGGENVLVLTLDDEHAEARETAKRIEQLRLNGMPLGDIAVFYRVNSLSRVLEEALLRAGLPYRIARGVEFYNRKEIKDLLAYLKLLVNPADDLSCERIINTPTRGIGAKTISQLRRFGARRGCSLFEAAKQVDEIELGAATKRHVRRFVAILDELREQLDQSVRKTMMDVYDRSGLEEALSADDEDNRQARANIEELINTSFEFDEENPDATLSDYLHQISLVSDLDHMEGSDGAVTLMTLHAAKGLEFPAVFIVGVEEGMLPFQRGDGPIQLGENSKEMEEERRLAFVGITRAMQRLTLMNVRTRMFRGRTTPQTASRFLDEIGEESITREDLTTVVQRSTHARGRFHGDSFHAETRQREVIETMTMDDFADYDDGDNHETPMPSEYEYLRPGCMVRHPRFGIGKLVKLSQRWPDTRATVLFHEVGQKNLVLAMAKLELMDEGF